MKTFTQLNNVKECVTADINPGNSFLTTGVTNHLTPINNIVTNVKNLFSILPVVVSVAEDGVSIKINSSKFTSKADVEKILYQPAWNGRLSLYSYICQQGLCSVKMINLGQFIVVYICPNDIATSLSNICKACACKEMLDYNVEEAEMFSSKPINESEDDEEMEDLNKTKLAELIEMPDKVKAAKKFELLVGQEMELPREFYFAAVKDKRGHESIALRWKYIKRGGKNTSAEITKSLINIYDLKKDGMFIADFDKDSLVTLPDEVEKLIKNLIEFIGAEKTSDPAVFSLTSLKSAKKDDKDDKDNKDDKKDTSDKKDSKSKSDDSDDDSSKGDLGDLL